MDDGFSPAVDAKEQLRRWDSGRSIWSIEMGGIGPGYEQAIQTLAIEIVRDELTKPVPEKPDREWGMSTVERIDIKLPDGRYSCGGFSGAQVRAARQLAYSWLTIGPAAVQQQQNAGHIQVSSFWPRAPKPAIPPAQQETTGNDQPTGPVSEASESPKAKE